MTSVLKNKELVGTFLKIALPVAFQNLLTFSVGLMDSIMVGSLGEAELSAVSIANQPFFLYMMVIFGLSSGASVLISQYWGKNDTEAISKVFGIVLKFAISIGFAAMILVILMPEQVMSIYTPDPHIVELGGNYLRVVGFSYLFFAFSNTYLNCIRSVEKVNIAVLTYSVSFVVNVFFNYMFIFGKFGAPALGVLGAAVGTLFARITEFVIVLVYSVKLEKKIKLRFKYIIKSDKLMLKDFKKYSLPVVINEVTWGLGTSLHMAILGRMSISAVSTVSIVSTAMQVMGVLMYGAASATLVIVGKKIGAKEYNVARKTANTLLIANILIAFVAAGLLLLSKNFIMGFYTLTPETAAAVNATMFVGAGVLVFQSINLSCIVGTFRGGGDTHFAMLVDILGMWCIAVPLGLLSGLYFGLSIPIVYIFLRSDEVVKAVACLFRMRSGKWLKNVTRESDGNIVEPNSGDFLANS